MNIYMIIPCYNVEKYIKRCIDSIKKQTDSEFLTVFVDDGSTDSTMNLIEYNIKNVPKMILIHQNNQGVSSARNTGLNYVFENYDIEDDDYITFMDPDDEIELTTVEEMRNVLTNNNVDAVYFGYHWDEENAYRVVIPYEYDEVCDTNFKVVNNVIPR